METADLLTEVAIVVIGRNEGARLGRSLDAVAGRGAGVVYVDSASVDESVEVARQKGLAVVELDPRRPFSAARGRNEGFGWVRRQCRTAKYVQFVDGDCELAAGWLEAGARFLRQRPDCAIVAGRLREREPDRTLYNAVCDIEWEVPAGESRACGGNFMVRADAFERAGGFREDLLAGEEPELARRLRTLGWRTWQLPAAMAVHDAAISRFSQWWRRSMRNGYGFAQGHALDSEGGRRLWARELRSARLWAGVMPATILACALLAGPPALVLLLAYPIQVARLALRGTRAPRVNWWHAALLVLGKFAELAGSLKYLRERYLIDRGRPQRAIRT